MLTEPVDAVVCDQAVDVHIAVDVSVAPRKATREPGGLDPRIIGQEDAGDPPPVVLLGHGGGQHKGGPGHPCPSPPLVATCGFAAVAIDAPGHGDRARTDRNDQVREEMRWRMTAHEPVGDVLAKYHREVIPQAVADHELR